MKRYDFWVDDTSDTPRVAIEETFTGDWVKWEDVETAKCHSCESFVNYVRGLEEDRDKYKEKYLGLVAAVLMEYEAEGDV